jgi:hypothetical protein
MAGERDPVFLADGVGRALVVGVDVRQRQQRDGAPAGLLEDAALVELAGGVDQRVADEIDVDQRARPGLVQALDASGDRLQWPVPSMPMP